MLDRNCVVNSKEIIVPGDKSISQRIVIFSAINPNLVEVTGILESEDVKNTMSSMQKIGAKIEKKGNKYYIQGLKGKKIEDSSHEKHLDFGNSGTGMRLSSGLLAGLEGSNCILTGDESLCSRPMGRVIRPLQQMGASIESKNKNEKAPLYIHGKKLVDFDYYSEISSAQIKSCLILASLASSVSLIYEESEVSRNHSENLLRFLGINLQYLSEKKFMITPPYDFRSFDYIVPSDISSASFFIIMGLLAKKGSLYLKNILLNPTRIGILSILKEMGGNIKIENERELQGERVGDIITYPSDLKKIVIQEEWIPSIIDEIPILTIAGIFSKGGFTVRFAKELRHKESDRIRSMVINLLNLGIDVEEYEDGYSFKEVKEINSNCIVQSFKDHRIAMSFLILKKISNLNLSIDELEWINTSFPTFLNIIDTL